MLSAYAHATQRIGLGTGVIPIYPRHPVAMAQEASTFMELSGGRLRLGIGLSHRPAMADGLRPRHGRAAGRDARVRGRPAAALHGQREPSRGGTTGSVGQARSGRRRRRCSWRASRRRCSSSRAKSRDGVVLWLAVPAYVRDVAVPALARGRARAGKPLEGFEIVAAVPLAVTQDHAERDPALPRGAGALSLAAVLPDDVPGERLRRRARGVRPRSRTGPGCRRGAAALVDALGAIGDARRARAEVEAYRAAGVTLPVVRPIGSPEAAHARATLEAVAP